MPSICILTATSYQDAPVVLGNVVSSPRDVHGLYIVHGHQMSQDSK